MAKLRSFSQVLNRLTKIAKEELHKTMSRKDLSNISLVRFVAIHINLSEKQTEYRFKNCNWSLGEWADVLRLANSDRLQQATNEEFTQHRNELS